MRCLAAAALLSTGIAQGAPAAVDVEQQVKTAARDVLEEQADRAGMIEPLFDLTVVKGTKPIPPCPQNVVVEGVDTRHPSRMRMAAICPATDGWRQEFVVRATVSARVLVAAAELPAGKPLAAADMTLDRRDVTAIPDAMSETRNVEGMTSRRTVHTGDVLRQGTLAAAMLVRRGQTVRIVARSGPIEVTVSGEALDDGARDATVRVRNAGNGNVIRARVVSEGAVAPVDSGVSTPAHSLD